MSELSAWKLLSILLDHPTADVLDAREELAAAARELPEGPARAHIVAFCERFLHEEDGWEERYTATFDFSRRTALNLTWFTHGDRRQRGVALLTLKRLFAVLGLELAADELPDHLPLLLELCDVAGEDVGRTVLADFRPALEVMTVALDEGGSPYVLLLDALLELLGPITEDDVAAVLRLASDGPPSESVGLEPFGPPEVMPTPVLTGACS